MLFWIFVITMIIGIVCWIVGYLINSSRWEPEGLEAVGIGLALPMIAAVFVCGVVFATNYINVDADIAQYQQEYKSLTYQLENNVYDNDNDIGKKELYEQVQEWNEDLAFKKANQDNFWVGIFYPDVYDQLEFIEYPNVNAE